MKLDKLLEQEDQFLKTREEIVKWIEENLDMSSFTYKINDDLSVDINGNFKIESIFLDPIYKLPIKLNKITGNVQLKYVGLVTLEGFPDEIGR
jgi:hypothetical protein